MLEPFRINSETEAFSIPNRLAIVEANLTSPEGKDVTWHCMKMRHIAVVLAVNDKGEACLKREWRLSRKDFVWELPSGFIDAEIPSPDDIEAAANRELQEEAGIKAGKLEKLLSFCPHNHMRTQAHLFLGIELVESKLPGDEHELVEVEWVPFDEAYERIMTTQVPNAQTALAFALAKERRA